jgi:ribosomal protein S18 acetylase RimI-like enzyme
MPIPGVSFDLVAPHELEAALVLEQEGPPCAPAYPLARSLSAAGFPQEEAATLEYLQYRQQNAPELFLGAFTWLPPMPRRLVGFICSTISTSSTLTHDSLSKHEPEGTTVCVHSVVVHPTLQGRGLAVDMVRAYIARLDWQRYHRVRLIAHAPLVGLYQRAGLELIGPSDVQLGPDPWLELGIDLVDEATRNPGRPWTAYASRSGVLRDEAGKSAVDVYCPRRQCRSHILRRGAAEWSENALEPVRRAGYPICGDFRR